MTSQAGHGDDSYRARCTCGLALPRPWDLIGHFLAVYPPHARQPLDNIRHADVTRLAVKLREGPTEVWEAGTWARDPRKHLRVAAAIAMGSATGNLEPWATITQRQVAETYHVSVRVARNAIAELTAAGILGHFGRYNNVMSRDIVQGRNRTHRAARVLSLTAARVADLEAELTALKARMATPWLEAECGSARNFRYGGSFRLALP
jgi:hypothetical protein